MPPVETRPELRLPDGVAPLAYDLRLEIDPDSPEFQGTVAIRVRLDGPTRVIWLHADMLRFDTTAYRVGDRTGEVTIGARTRENLVALELDERAGPGEITLELAYRGTMAREQEGLFRQRADKQWFVFSQGQAVAARQILPCFDEPRFKVPWTLTLVVPAKHVALANTPVEREQRLPDGRREVRFVEIPALPSYLLAIAVGPFTLVEGPAVGRAKLPVRFAVWGSAKGKLARAKATIGPLVDALEGYFDQAVPVSKLDVVAVPAFFGAMENPGLITIDAAVLFGDDEWARYMAHELAHQWLGNLVTPAWWDDLWISEAFAAYLGDELSRPDARVEEPELARQRRRSAALAVDASVERRPLRPVIASSSDVDNTFDSTAYDKGAAILAMFEGAIGSERFRAMLRGFVRAHAGGAVTVDDLAATLAAATTPAYGDALRSVVAQAGTPIVDLTLACDGVPHVIARARDGLAVPVCVRTPEGTTCGVASTATELALTTCPSWVVGNARGQGYYLATGALPAPPIATMLDAERLAYGEDLAAQVERGELVVADAVRAIRAFATSGARYASLAAMPVVRAVDRLVRDDARPRWAAWLASTFAGELTEHALFEPPTAHARYLRDELVAVLPAEAYPAPIVKRAAELATRGAGARTMIAMRIAGPRVSATMKRRLGDAMKRTRDPDARTPIVAALVEVRRDELLAVVDQALAIGASIELAIVLRERLEHPATASATWAALNARLPQLLHGLDPHQATELLDATGALCDRAARDELRARVEPKLDSFADGRRHLDLALAAIDRCVARRTAAGDLTTQLP